MKPSWMIAVSVAALLFVAIQGAALAWSDRTIQRTYTKNGQTCQDIAVTKIGKDGKPYVDHIETKCTPIKKK
jgi:hypothetical protein